MGHKKKRSTENAINEGHGTDVLADLDELGMSSVHDNIQSRDSMEIKQENDIKQEPVFVSRLMEVSASTHRNVTHVPGSNEHDEKYNFDYLNMEEVKTEMKKECDDKKEEESKTNDDSDEESTDGQQDQQPSPQDEDDLLQQQSGNNTQTRADNALKNTRKQHKCGFCEYSTSLKGNLNQHLLKHTGEKPHGCEICPKRFTKKQNLNVHMKYHVEELLFHCSGCLKGFHGKDKKTVHEMNCEILRYECHLCKGSFGSMKVSLIRHMRVHSGEKPFECKECFKQFTEKSSLTKHMKLHGGPRSFRCLKCRERFSEQDERNVHEKKCSRHAYDCDTCGRTFGLIKSHLICHMRTHSGEKPFQCKECPKKFAGTDGLKKHMKTHTKKLQFKCLMCRQGFTKNAKRKAHQRNCNGRYYECYLCSKFFRSSPANLKSHMHTHSGEKSFQCVQCRNTFARKWNLKRHIKNTHNQKY